MSVSYESANTGCPSGSPVEAYGVFYMAVCLSPPPQFPSSDSDWTGLEWNLSFSIKKQIKRQITMMAQLDSRNTQYLNVYEKYTFDWLSQYAI